MITLKCCVFQVKAFDYFLVAAQKGQLSACGSMAMYNMRGHPKVAVRSPELSVE